MLLLIIICSIFFLSYTKITDSKLLIRLINYGLILSLIIDTVWYNLYLYNKTLNMFYDVLVFNFLTYYLDIFLYLLIILILFILSERIYKNKLFDYVLEFNKDLIIILLFNVLGLFFLIHSFEFISLYIAIELIAYSTFLIITIFNKSYKATKAAILYFFMGALISSFVAFQIINLFEFLNLHSLQSFIELNPILINPYFIFNDYILVSLFGCLLIISLLFKLGIFPIHEWLISIYDHTPILITLYISLLPKLAILSFLIFNNSLLLFNSYTLNIISLLAISCMLIGSIGGLSQIRLKRLIAFSGLTNLGYILILLLNHNNNISSYLYFITQYSLNHIALFLIILFFIYYVNFIFNIYNPIIYISQLKGLIYHNFYLIFILNILLFSLIGIPPLLGFFAKLFLLIFTLNNCLYFLLFILILSSLISTVYYLNLLNICFKYNNNILILNNSYPSFILSYILSSITVFTSLGFINNNKILEILNILLNIWI